MCVATGLFYRGDFVEDPVVITSQKNSAVDYHVDFVGAVAQSAPDLSQFQIERHQTSGKGGRNGGDLDSGAAEETFRDPDQSRINANGGARRHVVTRIGGLHRFAAKESDFAGRVFSLNVR